MASHNKTVVINLVEEEGEREYDEEEFRRIIDLTQENENDELPLTAQYGQQSHGLRRPKMGKRNAPLDSTHRSVRAYSVQGIKYRVNDFVELAQPVGAFWRAQFVEVKQIWVNASFGGGGSGDDDKILLRGLPYARNSDMGGRFERRANEVCQLLEIDDDDNRPDEQQAMIEVRPREILTTRVFHKTNTDYHSARNCRFGNDPSWLGLSKSDAAKRQRADLAPLTCRWKMRFDRFRKVGKTYGTAVIHLAESDIHDPNYRIPDEERRRAWLKRYPGSAGGQRLQVTFGDAFCGCGGASSGARQAGLEPTIAIDNWETACESYKRNFPNTRLFQQDIHDFITRINFDHLPYIDVLHISPPCQFYSPAKVNEGKDDEKNEVALWACGELIERVRPRFFTMEQTYGLLAQRFINHFNKLIQCFTMHGYSVQWKERVELRQYGLPQNRKRLIIIGAAPGEQLPPWPAPTHGNGPGLKPWVTEAMAIGRFPRNVTHHDIQNARRVFGVAPRNPNMPLPKTICCSGAQGMMHYSGQRDYTIRELATLQGFALNHEFVGPTRTAIKRQIGNAFPASVSKVFFQTIRKFLERHDRGRMPAPPGFVGLPRLPGYSRLNANLDEDEGLQVAMRESRREQRHRRRVPEVITIYDSDEDDLPGSMARLSVKPSQQHSSAPSPSPSIIIIDESPKSLPTPPSTGGSSSSQQTANSWSLLNTPSQPDFSNKKRRAPSSAASSVTMDNSPSSPPSPCQQQLFRKRKLDDEDDDYRHHHQTESARKRARETVDDLMDVELYHAKKLADREPARAAAREQASLPPCDDGRPLTFGNCKLLGKLPVTRDTGKGWEF